MHGQEWYYTMANDMQSPIYIWLFGSFDKAEMELCIFPRSAESLYVSPMNKP
jgi:hypothetical protein